MSQLDLTQWSQPTYVDDDFSTATPVGIPVFSSPIPANTDPDLFTQEYQQFLADFDPLPLNTPHDSLGEIPDYSEYVLVVEGPRRDLKGGVIQWARTYARVPQSYDEYPSFGYPFIGYQGVWVSGNSGVASPIVASGRPREVEPVTSRLHFDFFLVGQGGTYGRAGDIPILQEQRYYSGSMPANTFKTNFLMDAFSIYPATNPSRATYLTWVANAASLGWASEWVGKPGATKPGQIIAEPSALTRWKGNIWQRVTRYVLAQ